MAAVIDGKDNSTMSVLTSLLLSRVHSMPNYTKTAYDAMFKGTSSFYDITFNVAQRMAQQLSSSFGINKAFVNRLFNYQLLHVTDQTLVCADSHLSSSASSNCPGRAPTTDMTTQIRTKTAVNETEAGPKQIHEKPRISSREEAWCFHFLAKARDYGE